MGKIADRLAALERTHYAVTPGEIAKAMDMLAARALAKIDIAAGKDCELPPEPPAHVLAEIERRYCTPENIEEARAKLLRLLESRSRDGSLGTDGAALFASGMAKQEDET